MSDSNVNERIAALSPEKRELLLKKLMEKQKNKTTDTLPQIEIETDMEKKFLPFEFTEVQQVYWMGQSGLFDMSDCSTNVYSEYEIIGLKGISKKVFISRLEKALNRLIERHDILRAVVLPEGMQKILKEVPLYHIKCADLRGKSQEFVEEELDRVRVNMRTQKVEINNWPLFDFQVHYLDGKRVILHMQISALLIDGTSRNMFINELLRLTSNPSASLPPLECSYRDYAITWSKFKNSQIYKKSREYWLKQLPELLPGPVLPLTGGKNTEAPSQFETWRIELIDKQSWANLIRYASKFGLSGSSALLSAYVDMIAFWSSTKKFSIGVINTYRPPIHPKIEDMLGNFNTMQIVVADVMSGTFIERTEKLQQQVLYNIEHPYFSGPEVLREFNRVKVRSSKATIPIFFNSVINQSSNENALENGRNSELNNVQETFGKSIIKAFQSLMKYLVPSLDVRQVEANIYPSLIQLIPTIVEDNSGAIICKWQGVKNLFPDGVLREMVENYKKLLKRLSEKEESWHEKWGKAISELGSVDEYIASTKDETPNIEESLNTLFLRQVAKQEGKIAIVAPKGTLSYRELYCNSNRIATLLRKNGVVHNTLVAVMMEKSCEQIATILGILQAGAAYIPVDINISGKELEHLLEINSTYIVITQSWIGEKIECTSNIQRIYLDKEELSEVYEKPLNLQQKSNDLACIIYNSDCMDSSKGLRINHSMVANAVLDINQRLDVNSEDKILSVYPSVSEQWLYDIFGMLITGGTVLLPQEQHGNDVFHWCQLLQREQVTVWNSSPVLFESLINFLEEEQGYKLCSLRLVLLNNERVSGNLFMRIKNLLGDACVVHLWGTSEASVWSMMHLLKKSEEDEESVLFDQVLNGQRVYILNEALQQCPIWTMGNIYIGGKSIEAIEKDSFKHPRTGEPLLRTIYMGRYTSEGNIEVIGEEADFKTSIGGYYILPYQVESELECHPDVRLAVVHIEEEWNHKKRLVAYIVRNKKATIGIEEVREFLKERLPYYMIPTDLVILDSIPLNLNGRINRSCLTIPSLNYVKEQVYVSPKNELEASLLKIWEKVLEKDRISIKDNFFDLGGDSLKVLKISYLIEKEFGKKITPASFFADPTIEQLARALS